MEKRRQTATNAWWNELTSARQQLVRAALRRQLPPWPALTALESWGDELLRLPEGEMSVASLADAWGNLQLILVECGLEHSRAEDNASIVEMAWQRVRRSAELIFQTLLNRPELASLHTDLRDEILPLLADAVPRAREGRIIRCIEASTHLHALALRTSGMPHAWLLACAAEMQYPAFTHAGWHGRMGIDFTWRRARTIVQALIAGLQGEGLTDLPLVVSCDSRVHAGLLASAVTEVASANGQPVYLCSRDTPAPALLTYLTHTLGIGHNAGLINCTASRLPVKEEGSGLYTGMEYQGIRYYTPYGTPAPARFIAQVERHAAELLLEPAAPLRPAVAGEVRMIDPLTEEVTLLIAEMGYPVPLADVGSEPALSALRRYWRRPDALIVIDEMHGASRGYLRAVCEELKLPCEVLHGTRNPLFGDLPAADPAPPHVAELSARVREVKEERRPLIGLAFDADADRLGVVDETGAFLPGNALLALLADFLLNEAYPGEPGLVVRDFTATRLLDRLTLLPQYVDRVLPPHQHGPLPAYMRAPGYKQLAGNPAALHSGGTQVVRLSSAQFPGLDDLDVLLARHRKGGLTASGLQEAYYACLDRLLIAGDASGGIVAHGHAPEKDALWAALLLLQLCAVRHAPVGELWRRLQEHLGAVNTEHLRLNVPAGVKLPLVNRYIQQYEHAAKTHTPAPVKIGGCAVEYAGGLDDQFIEWALRSPRGEAAFLTIEISATDPVIQAIAEGSDRETTHPVLLAVAERVEGLIIEQLRHAENAWRVVETLASIQLPPAALTDLPGTLNCRIAAASLCSPAGTGPPGPRGPRAAALRHQPPCRNRTGKKPRHRRLPPGRTTGRKTHPPAPAYQLGRGRISGPSGSIIENRVLSTAH